MTKALIKLSGNMKFFKDKQLFYYFMGLFGNSKPLKGKVAVVTGGLRGIGQAIADKLASSGAKVVVCDKNPGKSKHYFVQCDVSNSADVQNLVESAVKKYKKIDILVNNAGIFPFTEFKDMTEAQWDLVLNVNLKGVFNCSKAVLPYMVSRNYGKIISITSIAGVVVGYPNLVHYCASKAGISGFTKALAIELAQHKINVNAVAPGAIDTPGVQEGMDPAQKEATIQSIPVKRMGTPKEIAEVAVFLASDASSYITGQTIIADGGYTSQ